MGWCRAGLGGALVATLWPLLGSLVAWTCAFAVGPAAAGELTVQVRSAAGRPLADAVVFLESREAKAATRAVQGAEVTQIERRVVPAVTVLPIGSALQFPNRDKVRHHVYSFSPSKTFELKLYTGTPANPVLFDRPGIVVLGCNIHDDMAAWVVVVETPYYGKTGIGGSLTLADVPAGSYRLRVWHAALPVGAPASDQPLVLGAGSQQQAVRLDGVAL